VRCRWNIDEVMSFLEYKILKNEASEDEVLFYEEYIWTGEIDKNSNTYHRLIKQMKKEWEAK
jgi:quinol monooxygenase YgiN